MTTISITVSFISLLISAYLAKQDYKLYGTVFEIAVIVIVLTISFAVLLTL